jgi:hypothetical protein
MGGLLENAGYILERVQKYEGQEEEFVPKEVFDAILGKCQKQYHELVFNLANAEDSNLQCARAIIVYNAYKDFYSEYNSRESYSRSRAELKEISKLANKLSKALDSASPHTMEILRLSDRIVSDEMLLGSFESRFGHPIYRHETNDGAVAISFWMIPNIIKMIDVFSKISVEAVKWNKPTSKGGAPRDEATHMLVSNLERAWTLLSDAPFTFRHHKSEPTAPATTFCWEIFKHAEPEAEWSKFSTAMKKVIAMSGRKPGRPARASTEKLENP